MAIITAFQAVDEGSIPSTRSNNLRGYHMEDKIYWFITVFEYCEEDPLGWPKFGATRCWGFYCDKQDALNTLHENRTDLWETCNNYAILEPYYEGVCGIGDKEDRQFFKYDKERDGYFEIDEPACCKHIVGFGLG